MQMRETSRGVDKKPHGNNNPKSSLLVQGAWNIVKDVPNATVQIWDFERSHTLSRIEAMTGASSEAIKEKFMILNSEISIEKMYKAIRGLAKIKCDNFDLLAVDSGRVDDNGEPFMILPPTIVIIDSWSTMVSDKVIDVDNVELGISNMTGATQAKDNNNILNSLIPVLEQARISLFIVAHISKKVETGPVKTAAQINYLGQDENIAGGSKCIYLADTFYKLTAGSKLEPDKDFGVKGFMVKVKTCKSRSNEAGQEVELVYEQKRGFSNVLSNFNFIKKAGMLGGNGRAYYIKSDLHPELADIKFTQKTFIEKYESNEEFANKFDEICQSMYMDFIYQPEAYDEVDENPEEFETEE